MSETRTLHTKLAQVMYEAERIPKNGVAPAAMGGFRFVQVGDAADAIRKALAEKKISMIPTAIEVVGEAEHTTSNGKVMTTLTVRTTWTLTDGDSGESISIQSLGSGADTGDKAAPKAQSNAMKYALLMGFLLSTGDDPEQTDTSDRQRTSLAQRHPGIVETAAHPARAPIDNGGLIGIAALGKIAPVDGLVRQTPDGNSVGFVIGEGREKVQIVAYGDLAESLAVVLPGAIGKRVQVFGTTTNETMKAGGRNVPFLRMRLERIEGPGWTLPASDEPALPEPPDDVELVGEGLGLAG